MKNLKTLATTAAIGSTLLLSACDARNGVTSGSQQDLFLSAKTLDNFSFVVKLKGVDNVLPTPTTTSLITKHITTLLGNNPLVTIKTSTQGANHATVDLGFGPSGHVVFLCKTQNTTKRVHVRCLQDSSGCYGDNPNRTQHNYQFQVVLIPSPDNIQELYLQSLKTIDIDPHVQDIRFVEDNLNNMR